MLGRSGRVLATLALVVTSGASAVGGEFAPIDANDLYPLEPRAGHFRFTAGDREGERLPFRLKKHGEHWVWTYSEWSRHYLRRTDEGAIVVTKEEDLREGLQIIYDPPVPFLPARVTPDSEETGESSVVIRELDSGEVRNRGTCRYAVRPRGYKQVETPSGTSRALLVQAERTIKAGLLEMRVEIRFAFRPGTGQVAETVDRKARLLGIFGRSSHWRLELAKEEVAESTSGPD